MDMKELRKNAEKVIAERFPDFNFSTLDWGELDPFYLEHPEEIPIEHEFVGYRQAAAKRRFSWSALSRSFCERSRK